MQKIVITGGLGYIGTELCKIYSGEARYKNIVVVDNRFVSERVAQLRNWGISFIQCSILDEAKISDIVKDADTVIHLAGITDVAYTNTESNPEQDRLIKETAVTGTRNLIKHCKKDCRFIFPSTHVVFEGLEEPEIGINENRKPEPILSYANGKFQSEIDLKNYNNEYFSLNYVILRLGSVYGYSTDTMRINIMPNLFAKITSQDGTIKLFGGGKQWKSLVSVYDVARCMKYMEEHTEISQEIFHVTNEQVTVKEVASLCKEIRPSVNIIETDDEIPNLGYTLSNKKLKKTGFKFLYDLKTCLTDMITKWSVQDINPKLEYIDKGGNSFEDGRGIINNYELTEPINLIGAITSKKGSVRANHYHPIQEQKCLLISGQYISIIKDLANENSIIETKVINPGDIAIIKPNVAHTMVFTEDSVFLNLVRGERDHDNYGITHTIPYLLVDDKHRDMLLECYRTKCRCCGNVNLDRIVSLGYSPLANNLLNDKEQEYDKYPLEVNYCQRCYNAQLSVSVPSDKMFDEYLYVSSTSPNFVRHFNDAADKYIEEFSLNEDTIVVDIGSNDGIGLKKFIENGIPVFGIEPAKNIAKIANDSGVPTINGYFDKNIATQIASLDKNVALVTASNVFAHSDDLYEMAKNAFYILQDGGTFIIEVQYLLSTVLDGTFDNIYHEHVNYWTVSSLTNFFYQYDIVLYRVEYIDTHGGSIRAYLRRKYDFMQDELYGEQPIETSVREAILKEYNHGLCSIDGFKHFADNVIKAKENVNKNIALLKKKYPNRVIAGYGAPAKATTKLNFFGLNDRDIDYVIEDNSLKHDKYIPGTNIKIIDKKTLDNVSDDLLPEIIIVFAWNFFDEIVKNNSNLLARGVKFINIKSLEE